jgi:charged multivesicular body protein 1
MKAGHHDIARIYAQNAIRKQNEKLNLLRLASRIDAVSSRVQTAVTMRQVTGSMANVVRGMDGAMKSMDLEKVGTLYHQVVGSMAGTVANCASDICRYGQIRESI